VGTIAGRAAFATWRHTACAAALALLFVSGCAVGRKSMLPEPRVRDAGALRAEAAARPADAEPYYQLALLHAGASASDSALVAVANALRRDPQHVPSLALLARLLHDAGRSDEGHYSSPGSRHAGRRRIDIALLYADVGNTLRPASSSSAGGQPRGRGGRLAYLDLLDEDSGGAPLAGGALQISGGAAEPGARPLGPGRRVGARSGEGRQHPSSRCATATGRRRARASRAEALDRARASGGARAHPGWRRRLAAPRAAPPEAADDGHRPPTVWILACGRRSPPPSAGRTSAETATPDAAGGAGRHR
jgi:hypothetical protein